MDFAAVFSTRRKPLLNQGLRRVFYIFVGLSMMCYRIYVNVSFFRTIHEIVQYVICFLRNQALSVSSTEKISSPKYSGR